MTVEFIWDLPTAGDGRHARAAPTRRGERDPASSPALGPGVSDPRGARFNYFDYLHQVARAADLSGFDAIRIGHDPQGDEAWIVAGYVARHTRHVRLLTEFEAGWGSAVYAAKNAVTFQRYTGGRQAWQISHGAGERERRANGDPVPDTGILDRIDEFLTVARGVQTSAPFNFQGSYFEVKDGGFKGPLANNPVPAVYLSGSTEAAFALSSRQADVHVLDAAPVASLAPAIATLQALASRSARTLGIGLRIGVLARETEQEARRDAERYAHQGGAAGKTDLVGSYDQVSDQLAAYAEAGVSSFLLSGVPSLEEAYRVGEHILPALRARLTRARQAA